MKRYSRSLTRKPKMGITQAAQPSAFAKNAHNAGNGNGPATPSKKALRAKSVTGIDLKIINEIATGLTVDARRKAIGVSERTAHRIKTDPDKPLDARTSDGIYRLESVRALAREVLGSDEAANEWLNTEAMGLEFRKPIDLVSTSPGAEAVKTLLQRMKYGVYA